MQFDQKTLRKLALILAALALMAATVMAQTIATKASSTIGSFKEDWGINLIEQETDYNGDGVSDMIVNVASMNNTYLEIYANDTRETEAYKWASAICNITGVTAIGKWEYNPATKIWAYTGLLNYGNLTNYGLNSSWCPDSYGMGFVLFGAGSGDKQYRLNFSYGRKEITIYTGKGTSIINTGTTVPFYPNQRAICRDALNYIHVAYLYSSSTVAYAYSTDNGATFTTSLTVINGSGATKNTPSISCNGNNITVAYVNGTSSLAVFTSTNNGGTWTDVSPSSATTGKTVYEVDVERRGTNIYLVYGNASTATTRPSIIFLNSTTGGSTWGAKKVVIAGSYLRVGSVVVFDEYLHPSLAVNGTGGSTDILHVMVQEDALDVSSYFGIYYINSSNSGSSWSTIVTILSAGSGQMYYPSITFSGINLYGSFYRSDNTVWFSNSTNNGASWTTAYQISVGTNATLYPSISLNGTNPIVFWQNGTANQNIQYRSHSGSVWNVAQNITTDSRNNTYVNSKVDYSGSCTEYVYRNSTDGTNWNITYDFFGTCTAPVTGVQPQVGDPFRCSIPYLIPLLNTPILCMPTSNITGQPLTGQTINCQAQLALETYTGGVQASSAATEQANGLYNWTLLASNLAANTCYTINCSTSIGGTQNNVGSVLCVLPNYATPSDITNSTSVILGNMSSNFTNTNNLIAYLTGNMSANFTAITSLLNTINASVVSVNTTQNGNYAILQTEIISVNTTQNANAQAIIDLLNLVGANITSVNTTMLTNFSTLYTVTLSVNNTVNTGFINVLAALVQMNGTINGINATMVLEFAALHNEIQSANNTIIAVGNNVTQAYNLLQTVQAELIEHNSTLTAYYNALQASNQNLNGTLLAMNSSMMAEFNSASSKLDALNITLNGAAINITLLQGNLSLHDAHLLAMNSTMVSSFNTVYTMIISTNSTQNANALTITNLLNALELKVDSINTTMQDNFTTTYALIVSTNSSQNANAQTILNLLGAVGINVTSTNITVQAGFNDMNSTLAGINNTLNQVAANVSALNLNLTYFSGNLTADVIAAYVWNFTRRTTTPLSTTVLTLSSSLGWKLLKGYAPTVSCTSNQNESNVTLYFDNAPVTNPYTYAPSEGSYEVRCTSPQSTNYSAGVGVAYLNITITGTGGAATLANATTNATSPLVAEATKEQSPLDWLLSLPFKGLILFIEVLHGIYDLLTATLIGLPVWAYLIAILLMVFAASLMGKQELRSLGDVPIWGLIALLLAIFLGVVFILASFAVK